MSDIFGDFRVTTTSDELLKSSRAFAGVVFSVAPCGLLCVDGSRGDAGVAGFIVCAPVPRRLLRRAETVQQRRQDLRLRRLVSADQARRLAVQLHDAVYGRPMEYGRPLYFHAVICSSSFFFLLFSSRNLSRGRLDVCHTSTHDVALVRI